VLNQLQDVYVNHVTSAAHLILLLLAFRIGTPTGWLCVLTAIGLISLCLWVANFRRARAVTDTPTSRVASAPQGYVELCGQVRAHPGYDRVSPVSALPCVWYRYKIEEKSGRDWNTVDHGVSSDTFLLDDGSGQVIVDPDFAEVMTTRHRKWTQDDRRYNEWLLTPGDRVYAIGQFTTVGGASSSLDVEGDVGSLLSEWKTNQAELKRRFDLDGDGKVDLKEWELARHAARREVLKHHTEIRSQPGSNLLRKPADGRLFLLSNLDSEKLARRYVIWTALQLGIAIAAGGSMIAILTTLAVR
jgi:hypothetical protein